MRNRQPEPIKSVQRRLQVEARLADYPKLPPEVLADVINWFKREASAMEVATVASNPEIQEEYRQFRDKHLDRLSAGEVILTGGLAMILIFVTVALIVMP